MKKLKGNFTQFSNELFNYDLTGNAFKIYCWLLSKDSLKEVNPDWSIIKNVVQNKTKIGRDAFHTAWTELKSKGFLIHNGFQTADGQFKNLKTDKGFFTHSYSFIALPNNPHTEKPYTDKKQSKKSTQKKVKPHTDDPHTDDPHTDDPHTEKPYANSKTNFSNTELSNINYIISNTEISNEENINLKTDIMKEGNLTNEEKEWLFNSFNRDEDEDKLNLQNIEKPKEEVNVKAKAKINISISDEALQEEIEKELCSEAFCFDAWQSYNLKLKTEKDEELKKYPLNYWISSYKRWSEFPKVAAMIEAEKETLKDKAYVRQTKKEAEQLHLKQKAKNESSYRSWFLTPEQIVEKNRIANEKDKCKPFESPAVKPVPYKNLTVDEILKEEDKKINYPVSPFIKPNY